MYQKAMTGLALRRVFLRVNRFVISNKQQPDTTNKLILQYELLTVKKNELISSCLLYSLYFM